MQDLGLFWQLTLKTIENLKFVSSEDIALEMFLMQLMHIKSLDEHDVEKIVVGGRILYSTEVSANEIYDLKTDPEGYVKKIKHPDYGLRKGVEYNELLEFIRDKTPYKGIFYGRSFDLVSWLEPIEIYKSETEAQ